MIARLVGRYTSAAIAEVDGWADAAGACELTSVYVGGGTPTLALDAVAAILDRARRRFRLTGDIAIETNPADVDVELSDGCATSGSAWCHSASSRSSRRPGDHRPPLLAGRRGTGAFGPRPQAGSPRSTWISCSPCPGSRLPRLSPISTVPRHSARTRLRPTRSSPFPTPPVGADAAPEGRPAAGPPARAAPSTARSATGAARTDSTGSPCGGSRRRARPATRR